MIRLESEDVGGRQVIRVDGSLDAEGAAELSRLCAEAAGQPTLDLANRGVELKNVPPYIALRLDRAK